MILSGKGPLTLQNAYVVIIEPVAVDLAKNTASPIESYCANLRNTLQQGQIALSNLQSTKIILADKSAKKRALLAGQARLASLQQQEEIVFKKKISQLNQSTGLYTNLSRQIGEYLDAVRKNALASAKGAAFPTRAMTALLLGNQIQQSQRELTDVRNRLTVSLPLEIAQTQVVLANNKQQQVAQKTAVEQAQLKYEDFDTHHARAVKAQQANIDKLKTQFDNIQNTRRVAPPALAIIHGRTLQHHLLRHDRYSQEHGCPVRVAGRCLMPTIFWRPWTCSRTGLLSSMSLWQGANMNTQDLAPYSF